MLLLRYGFISTVKIYYFLKRHQIGRSNDIHIDFMLHFADKEREENASPDGAPAAGAVLSGINADENDGARSDVVEEGLWSRRSSRFAARIIIERKTQKAFIFAGAFDCKFQMRIGVHYKTLVWCTAKQLSCSLFRIENIFGTMAFPCLTPASATDWNCGNRRGIR